MLSLDLSPGPDPGMGVWLAQALESTLDHEPVLAAVAMYIAWCLCGNISGCGQGGGEEPLLSVGGRASEEQHCP